MNLTELNTQTQTKESQSSISPDTALELLKEGNARFVKNKKADRDLKRQVDDTASGQYPFATVLHCIDSRVSAELLFDQGVGDVFSVRIAGNFVNDDILGSMEFATKLAGTKLVVVLGHTACGAVKGACDDAKLGNLTGMLEKIKPAVKAVSEPKDKDKRNSKNIDFVNEVAKKNVELTVENIRKNSEVMADLEKEGTIKIIGGMYDISNGKVTFYE